jgi:hypothetical protein
MKEEKEVILYCDFHGHSRKKNSFMCKTKTRKIILEIKKILNC